MKFRRALALILSALLLCSFLPACSESAENQDDPGTKTDAPNGSDASVPSPEIEAEDEDAKPEYYNMLPAEDFDGWKLTIANDGLSSEYFSGFCVDELTGDVFNDGLYNRRVAVQDKYNVVIEETNNGAANGIRQSVTSGSGDVGFGYVLTASCMGLISANYVLPITDLPTVDMSKPYWDKGAQQTLTFFDKMFFGYCDIGWDHYESMAVLFYNGFLLVNSGLSDSPYDLYMEGKWTLDRMYDMMNAVVQDADGDGKMTSGKDIFGWSGREFEYLPSLYSSNLRLVRYDETADTYVMDVTQDAVMAVGDKLNAIINDPNLSVPGRNDETRNMFKDGKCLFYSRLLGDFRNLRDKEDDYGIICYPSLEENTDGMVYVQQPYAILVPSDCPDTARIGTMLEALAAYTYDNVLDDYIQKTVIGKGARDQQSAELLEKFITIRAFDLCYAFNVFAPIDAYGLGVKGGNYASAQQRQSKVFAKSVAKSVEALKGKG